jgi:hypothetical protein
VLRDQTDRAAALLKSLLLLFWAAWLSVVFLTNLLDGGKALGLLGEDWPLASGNYAFVAQTTARYGTPGWVNALLFAGVVAWEGLSAVLFWLAWWGGAPAQTRRYSAFAVGLGLWAAFLLADEMFVAYGVAAAHWRPFLGQLATLLVIELLPGGQRGE